MQTLSDLNVTVLQPFQYLGLPTRVQFVFVSAEVARTTNSNEPPESHTEQSLWMSAILRHAEFVRSTVLEKDESRLDSFLQSIHFIVPFFRPQPVAFSYAASHDVSDQPKELAMKLRWLRLFGPQQRGPSTFWQFLWTSAF